MRYVYLITGVLILQLHSRSGMKRLMILLIVATLYTSQRSRALRINAIPIGNTHSWPKNQSGSRFASFLVHDLFAVCSNETHVRMNPRISWQLLKRRIVFSLDFIGLGWRFTAWSVELAGVDVFPHFVLNKPNRVGVVSEPFVFWDSVDGWFAFDANLFSIHEDPLVLFLAFFLSFFLRGGEFPFWLLDLLLLLLLVWFTSHGLTPPTNNVARVVARFFKASSLGSVTVNCCRPDSSVWTQLDNPARTCSTTCSSGLARDSD